MRRSLMAPVAASPSAMKSSIKRILSSSELTLSRDVISEDDNILLIDDFMADGEAATGAIRLLRMAHATVAGIGILIEKSFQPGRRKINEQGYEVYSLARIKYMDEYQIDFIEEN